MHRNVEKVTQRSAAGSREDLAVRWVKVQSKVMAYLLTVVRDYHHAEDLLQEVARVSAERFADYDRGRPFSPWVLGIARKIVLAYYRSEGNKHFTLPGDIVKDLAIAFEREAPELDLRRIALQKCVEKVTGRRREVLRMRYEKGLESDEIARQLGIKRNALFALLHRVRSTLMSCVQRELAREQR
ncbi:MAG: sigma-70 family RNA polymerase sigma factor [Pirellulales bacterium]|nr:sigma-70 family RNA polymerase sigma factor [Pirellulales bacterium]